MATSTTSRKPTKLQRKAAEAIRAAEREERTVGRKISDKGRSRRMPARAYRAARRNHSVLAASGAFVVAGLGWTLGKSVKWTAIYTARGSRRGGRRIHQHVRTRVAQRRWVPPGVAPPGKPSRSVVVHCYACQKSFRGLEQLNAHLHGHRNEKRTPIKPQPTIHRSATAKTAGRVIVRPAVTGGGRHRARHRIPNAQRVNALVATHQANLSKIGEKAMGNNAEIRQMVRGAKSFGDQAAPKTLGDLRESLCGMEKFVAAMNDALDDYMRTLVTKCNVDPLVLRPYFSAMKEAFTVAGQNGNRAVVAFEDYYNLLLKVAAQKGIPLIDLSKTG